MAGVRRQWPFLAFPGSKGTGSGSGGDYATRVVHLGARSSEARLGTACTAAEAGVRGGASQARSVWGSGRTYWSWQLAQKEEKGALRLTEGLWWPELLRRAAGVEVGRRRRRSSVTGMTQRRSGLLELVIWSTRVL